ncbi:hypothetical protein [Fundidesulfovibrio magnetotacticus]|uniref:hypothetical protein n=1 Tax=Fundidesulfovibrio magnetotacticus TaxID=2730080 RepID=UPI0015660A58|nr:hypothetical protein [Fundidesulfovibrio magnetotacticus]
MDGGSVVSVKFFEGGQSGPALAQRSYRDAFSRNNTRFIHYEVTMEFPLNATRTRTIELQCVCVASDGREIFRLTLPCKVEQGYEVGIYSLGWGREKTGGWEPGSYTVKFYFSDREVASGSFRVY